MLRDVKENRDSTLHISTSCFVSTSNRAISVNATERACILLVQHVLSLQILRKTDISSPARQFLCIPFIFYAVCSA